MRSSAIIVLFFCLLSFTSLSSNGQSASWSICPDAPTDITVQKVDLELANRNLSYAMTATTDTPLEAGSQLTIAVNLDGGQIFTENIDMAQGTNLPVAANSAFVFKYGVSIPSIAPGGSYVVNLTFLDQTGLPLTCVAVSFQLTAEKQRQTIALF